MLKGAEPPFMEPGSKRHDNALWRDRLYGGLRARALPLVMVDDHTIPAASIWTGARLWIEAFRSAGLERGDRVVLALDPSPAWVQVLVAAIWEGLTLIPLPSQALRKPDDIASTFDPALVVGCGKADWILGHDSDFAPRPDARKRETTLPTDPEIRLVMRTSGSSGQPRFVAISDENLLSVLDSHEAHLGLTDRDVCLSILPWHHAFGLVIDLLPALFAGATIVRSERALRDPNLQLDLAIANNVTYCSMVPLHVERLAQIGRGQEWLKELSGGVVGGAPISSHQASILKNTRLRVGYGQTEASPGIALGEPGEWHEGAIGSPIGCEIKLDERGHLLCRGSNACAGFWHADRGIDRLPTSRWLDTGDLATRDSQGKLRFIGRADDSFKLSNGRLVESALIERKLANALPEGLRAVLLPAEGKIDVVVLSKSKPENGSAESALRLSLGPLADYVGQVHYLRESAAPKTAKGDIDRLALGANLRTTLRAAA